MVLRQELVDNTLVEEVWGLSKQLFLSDYLILSSYVCSNIVANVVTNTYV